MSKNKLIEKLKEMKIEAQYGPYIHGIDLTSNMQQIVHNLLTAKEIGVTYIYDLHGITGMYWNPKARFLFNSDVNSEDDIYLFITGMTKNEYNTLLADNRKGIKR